MDCFKVVFRNKKSQYDPNSYLFVGTTSYFCCVFTDLIFNPIKNIYIQVLRLPKKISKEGFSIALTTIKDMKSRLFSRAYMTTMINVPHISQIDYVFIFTLKAYMYILKNPNYEFSIAQSVIYEFITGGMAGCLHGSIYLIHENLVRLDGAASSQKQTSNKQKRTINDPTLYNNQNISNYTDKHFKISNFAIYQYFKGGVGLFLHFFLYRGTYFAGYDFFNRYYELSEESLVKKLIFSNISTQLAGILGAFFYSHVHVEYDPIFRNNIGDRIKFFKTVQGKKFAFLTYFPTQVYIMQESTVIVLFHEAFQKYDDFITFKIL